MLEGNLDIFQPGPYFPMFFAADGSRSWAVFILEQAGTVIYLH